MTERAEQLSLFLHLAGWGEAKRELLAGDASMRRYDRLTDVRLGKAVLMDAPPEDGEDVTPFIKIATHLRKLGLSAPEILAQDPQNGFLILEDLGDTLFARMLETEPEQETLLYETAIDALAEAQTAEAPADLASYGPKEMEKTALLAPDWYLKYTVPVSAEARQTFEAIFSELLTSHASGPAVLTQRDYHAENLLWLPERDGVARVGLLDFQDAMLAHPAYDLASLLKDARRDVSAEVQSRTYARFLDRTGHPDTSFGPAYAICSAQRNLRIMGVFARLAIRDGKKHYPDLMPRVWKNLMSDLAHPANSKLKDWIETHMPPPTAEIIAKVKSAHV